MLTRKGRATRDRIVRVAADLILKQGSVSTTMEQVRASAGISFSQLYHYFEDKMALIRAVIDFRTQAIVDGQEGAFHSLDSMAALHAWRNSLVEIQRALNCKGGCPIGAMSELSEVSDEARIDLAEGFARWETSIRNGLLSMRDRGLLLPRADPDSLALALLAAVQGGLLLTQVRRETTPLEVALDTMLGHIESLTAVGVA